MVSSLAPALMAAKPQGTTLHWAVRTFLIGPTVQPLVPCGHVVKFLRAGILMAVCLNSLKRALNALFISSQGGGLDAPCHV